MSDYGTAFPNSRKVYERKVLDGAAGSITLDVPSREVSLSGGEPPVRLYDTSGPLGHDVGAGLPKLRESWVKSRIGAAGVTQLYYARRGEIDPGDGIHRDSRGSARRVRSR